MQTDMPFSLIVWEDVSNLPFPDEIKNITSTVNWNEFEWHVSGLPYPFAKFTMSGGKNLYLSELPNGEIKVRQLTDFTGDIIMAGFFVDEANIGEFNYFVNFRITILKGSVVDVKVDKLQKQPSKEYQEAMSDFNNNIKRIMSISSSWWFRWLYRPWFLCVRAIGFGVLFVLKFFKDVTVWVVSRLTPL